MEFWFLRCIIETNHIFGSGLLGCAVGGIPMTQRKWTGILYVSVVLSMTSGNAWTAPKNQQRTPPYTVTEYTAF